MESYDRPRVHALAKGVLIHLKPKDIFILISKRNRYYYGNNSESGAKDVNFNLCWGLTLNSVKVIYYRYGVPDMNR